MAENIMGMGSDSTIEDYITQYNSEEIVSSAFFLKQLLSIENGGKMIVNFTNLVNKYMPEIRGLKLKVTLSNDEYAKYKFNPKLLSYDIYGTTELWFLILEANELHSVTQFDSKTIYLFRTDIVDKLARILNLEMTTKNYNTEELNNQAAS